MEIFPGIEQDPERRFGKPCIKGTRVDVATILGMLAAGENMETIQKNYELTEDQIQDALRYGSHVTDHVPPAKQDVA